MHSPEISHPRFGAGGNEQPQLNEMHTLPISQGSQTQRQGVSYINDFH
jgi:hypothetical protein